jgi:chorismate synthase
MRGGEFLPNNAGGTPAGITNSNIIVTKMAIKPTLLLSIN